MRSGVSPTDRDKVIQCDGKLGEICKLSNSSKNMVYKRGTLGLTSSTVLLGYSSQQRIICPRMRFEPSFRTNVLTLSYQCQTPDLQPEMQLMFMVATDIIGIAMFHFPRVYSFNFQSYLLSAAPECLFPAVTHHP